MYGDSETRPPYLQIVGGACVAAGALAGLIGYVAYFGWLLTICQRVVSRDIGTGDFFLLPLSVPPRVIGALLIVGGLRILQGDDAYRRMLSHLLAALLPIVALCTVVFYRTGLTDPGTDTLRWQFYDWHPFWVAHSFGAATLLVLMLLLATKSARLRQALPSGGDGMPELPLRVLLIGWAATDYGALWVAGWFVLAVALLAPGGPLGLSVGTVALAVVILAATSAIGYYPLFGGIALLELRERGVRWLSNLAILALAFALLGALTGLLQYLFPSVQVVPDERGQAELVQRLPSASAQAVAWFVLLRLLQSRRVREAIAAAEAQRNTPSVVPDSEFCPSSTNT